MVDGSDSYRGRCLSIDLSRHYGSVCRGRKISGFDCYVQRVRYRTTRPGYGRGVIARIERYYGQCSGPGGTTYAWRTDGSLKPAGGCDGKVDCSGEREQWMDRDS